MSIVEHKVNRESWPSGEWDDESSDREEWRHEGLPCLMVRNSSGGWCGYVAVPKGHPWFEKAYMESDNRPDVHGGLTYSSRCKGSICHVPAEGESDNVWWLGFDCAHSGDISPGMLAMGVKLGMSGLFDSPYARYRDINYVKREVNSLAEQAKAAS